MNILNKVTLRSLLLNKTRTLVTIIGIMLSSAMICAVTTSVASLYEYGLKNAIYSNGSWHGGATGVDGATVEKTAAEAKDIATERTVGFADCKSLDTERPYYYIGGVSRSYFELMPVHVVEGRLPESPRELLLPDSLSIIGGVYHEVGTTLTLSVGNTTADGYYLENNESFTVEYGKDTDPTIVDGTPTDYTVVGYYDSSYYHVYRLPGFSCLTLDDGTPADSYNMWFTMEKTSDVYDYIMDNGLETGSTNSDVLTFLGVSVYSGFYSFVYSVAAIVILLIVFGSVSLIYNAFSISVSERTRWFGLLSSVGATRRQLGRSVMFEAFAVSAVGIPVGVLCGIGGIGITLLIIGDRFSSMFGFAVPMRVHVSWLSVAAAVAVSLITVALSAWLPSKRGSRVSAVEAIRQSRDIRLARRQVKTGRLTFRLFGLSGMLAAKNYRRNKKKYRTTVVSLFMSIVLFVSASSFTDYLVSSASGSFETNDYDIEVSADKARLGDNDPLTLSARLRDADGAERVAYTERFSLPITVQKSELTDLAAALTPGGESTASLYADILFVEDGVFYEFLQQNGIETERFSDAAHPLGVAADTATVFDRKLEKYVTVTYFKDEAHIAKSAYQKAVEGYYYLDSYIDENGGEVYTYRSDTDRDDVLHLKDNEAKAALPVGATVDKLPFFARDMLDVTYIYPLSAKPSVMTVQPDTSHYGDACSFIIDSSDHMAVESSVRECFRELGISVSLTNHASGAAGNRNMLLIIKVFCYGFIVLISLIAATNVFNTISTNISLRRREFAMLKSVGMSSRGFDKMMNYECLLYGSRALMLGLPVSAGVVYLIYSAMNTAYVTGYRLPLEAMLTATLCVFATVFVTMLYSMHKIKKNDPIDDLKSENI